MDCTLQANAEPDLAQTGVRLKPVMASLVEGILDLILPPLLAGYTSLQVLMPRQRCQRGTDSLHPVMAE